MYAITGITGNVGGSVANNLLAAGRPVRAVMRNVGKGDVWAERGCEVVQADIADATSLASAFKGAEGVFVLVPPNFDPAPGFPDRTALEIYRTRAAEAIHTHGGRYLARLGEVQLLERSWNPNMIVIIEFPNLEQARAWYRSPEYTHSPGLVIFKIYNGYWFFGRPTVEELRQDLRAVLKKCRPDWDITNPELRAAWERGERDRFYPYGKTYGQVFREQEE
jgi:uncharacterized protein (DUF1330 family)